MLPLVCKHYAFADKITIWDNYSEDNSVRIAEKLGCEVMYFGKRGVLDDFSYLEVKHKVQTLSSRADWVIIADMDEILHVKGGVREFLTDQKAKGVTAILTEGYNMFSEVMPNDLTDVTVAVRAKQYDKLVCFNPQRIRVRYGFGCHNARTAGRYVASAEKALLLHYKFLGGIDRVYEKYEKNAARMSAFNRKNKLGFHYLQTREQVEAGIKNELETAININI